MSLSRCVARSFDISGGRRVVDNNIGAWCWRTSVRATYRRKVE